MDFEFTINANSIIAFVGLLTSLGVLFALIKSSIHQVDKWNGYDKDIKEVKNKVENTETNINAKITSLKDEQYIQTRVLLAVLDGLHQQGCNGKVTEATAELTDFLNKSSHN